jgi:hypothetical protein
LRTLAERNLLLRVHVEFPEGLKLATDKFRKGWNLSRSVDVCLLEKRILDLGWSFIKIGEGTLRSGVGETAQEAIAAALKLALRSVDKHVNAMEVARIHLTQYPWFFLARVIVCPYLIQQGADLAVLDGNEFIPCQKRLPTFAHAVYPHFGGAVAQLRQMLISSHGSENRLL